MTQTESKRAYVFCDTMVYLHCHRVQDLDLPTLTGARAVTVVVPRITLQELDKHKNTHPSQKVRDRAADRLKTIKSSVADPAHAVRPGVSLDVVARRPPETAKEHGLNVDWPDDELIASVLEFRDAHPTDDVILISHDTGPQLTAMQLGIATREIPEAWRIPPEDDPLVAENRKLRNELLRIQNARPQPVLRVGGMQDEDDHVVFRLSRPEDMGTKNKAEVMAKLRESYPQRQPPRPKPAPINEMARISALLATQRCEQIPLSEYERYNRGLEHFFAEYEAYIDALAAHRTQPDRTITLDLEVRNLGGAPAEDVDIYVHFPDGFRLYSDDDLPREPAAPTPPPEPQTDTQRLLSRAIAPFHVPTSLFTRPALTKNTFSLEQTGSYELRQHFERIKHGYLTRIRSLYLVFDSFDTAGSFGFEYEITAGNVPDRVTGKLNIVIEKTK